MKKIWQSHNLNETSSIAKEILGLLSRNKNIATICALSGNLGAGKTAFTKEIAQHLGVTETVVSPTFVIAKFYEITSETHPWKQLVHIDAYRMESWSELAILGFDELFADTDNLVIIEWPEQVADTDQDNWIKIDFQLNDDESREIRLSL